MSTDDIVFDEVTYREPKQMRRPDRDPARVVLACGTPGADELPIFLDRKPADLIERHALSDTSVELGGILLGVECVDERDGRPFVWITEALEARHYENTQASFTYTHDSWEEISRERDAKYPDLDIVGWYHTHPDFGIFLSSHDLFIHHHFFAQPLQVAYVVDPIRLARGFFQWRDGEVMPVGGFHLTAGRGERLALARLVNDLENLPATAAEAGLSGLSPRLEAQLIAMLNRPQPTVYAGSSSPQGSTAFGLLGAALGALLLAAGLWFNSLHRTVEEQAEAIRGLEKAVTTTADDVDAARVRAKEQALDALLHEVRVGDAQKSFVTLYEQVVAQRDSAREQLRASQTRETSLNETASSLMAEQSEQQSRLKTAQVRADRLARELEASESTLKRFEEELEADGLIIEQTNAGTLARKYTLAWSIAAGALVGCVLLGLGLIWSLARVVPPADEDDTGDADSTPPPHPHQEPPHRIS